VGQAGDVFGGEVVPAKAFEFVITSSEAWADGCVGTRTSGEEIAEEIFDSCRFVEGH
jgi:hypothetical protein